MTKKIKSIKLKKDFPNNIWEENTEIDLFDYLQDDGSLLSDETGRIYPQEYPEFFEIEYELEKYAVHTPTKADYYEITRLYKIAGWMWAPKDYHEAMNFLTFKASPVWFPTRLSAEDEHTIITLSEARQKLQEMFPEKDFSEKPKQIFFDNGAVVLPLENRQDYWTIDYFCNRIVNRNWSLTVNLDIHTYRLQSQNIFLTKEAAENAKDVQDTHNRILAEVKKIDAENGWVADWNNQDQDKFYVFWYKKGLRNEKESLSHTVGRANSIYMCEQAKDYLMSDKVSDEDFKKFCLIYK